MTLTIERLQELQAIAEKATVYRQCDWQEGALFAVRDEPGEHDPCWLIMPGGPMLAFNHHAVNGVDQARAHFIAGACNAALLARDSVFVPDERMNDAIRILREVTSDRGAITDDMRMDHLCDVVRRIVAIATPSAPFAPMAAKEAEPVAWREALSEAIGIATDGRIYANEPEARASFGRIVQHLETVRDTHPAAPVTDATGSVDLCEVAAAIEQVRAEHAIRDAAHAVVRFADPFRAGFLSACEEIAGRLGLPYSDPDLPPAPDYRRLLGEARNYVEGLPIAEEIDKALESALSTQAKG